jgi:hypothetical protein
VWRLPLCSVNWYMGHGTIGYVYRNCIIQVCKIYKICLKTAAVNRDMCGGDKSTYHPSS